MWRREVNPGEGNLLLSLCVPLLLGKCQRPRTDDSLLHSPASTDTHAPPALWGSWQATTDLFWSVWDMMPATQFLRGPWIQARARNFSSQKGRVQPRLCPGIFSLSLASQKNIWEKTNNFYLEILRKKRNEGRERERENKFQKDCTFSREVESCKHTSHVEFESLEPPPE